MQQQAFFTGETLHENNPKVLSELRQRAERCVACKLHSSRTKVVWGEGNYLSPKVAFVGEAPGASEDAQGRPFVGRAGQLLDRMIARMGFKREDLYICNVVCCRPAENRVPEPDEVVACQPFLFGQLRLIRPQTIITLGATATQTLLRKTKSLKEMRGKWYKWESIPVRPTFHPAYLLRNPKEQATALIDLEAVLTLLRTLTLKS